jgi:APA family basic amino acid/polyamine antiporter
MAHPGHLLKILGLAFGLAAVVGNMVGQGILRSPGVVATGISEPAFILLAWLAGGVIAATAGLVYVELGTSIPRAGGQYDFVARAFGPNSGNGCRLGPRRRQLPQSRPACDRGR